MKLPVGPSIPARPTLATYVAPASNTLVPVSHHLVAEQALHPEALPPFFSHVVN